MLGKKNFFRNPIQRRLDPEPAYSGTVSFAVEPTHIAAVNNDIQVSVNSNMRLGKTVTVALSGIGSDYANVTTTVAVDAQGNANISVPIKLSTWSSIDSTAFTMSVTREGGAEIGSKTGNVYSTATSLTLATNSGLGDFTIGSGESRIEGIKLVSGIGTQKSFTTPSYNAEVNIMVIGGGGAGGTRSGGNDTAGAGGAGGFLQELNYDLLPLGNNYAYTLLAGAGNQNIGSAETGALSRLFRETEFVGVNVLVADGGGNGGDFSGTDGQDGGSGGGSFSSVLGSGGTGTSGQGFDGGRLINGLGGGGGGAGEAGNPIVSYEQAYGGNGVYSTITGASVGYAGGGYSKTRPASRADFGGGSGSGVAGTDFTGGGGGPGAVGGRGMWVISKHGDYTTNVILD